MYISFPHRRGGVPVMSIWVALVFKFSPQAWGCSGSSHWALHKGYGYGYVW
jgi:hypothetical protein